MTPEEVAARRHALELDEQGLAGAFLVEPLTALAGGLLGGALVSLGAYAVAFRHHRRRAAIHAGRRLLRRPPCV